MIPQSLARLYLYLALALAPFALHAADKPDIVVFLTDDHSQLDASPYGSTDFHTPNMQKLADEGLTFDQAFVASPSCAPSRAALLTGLMPARNGAEPNHARPHKHLKKWPKYFQDLGYEVVAYGKVAHYQHTSDYGFDSFAHDKFHDHEAIPAAAQFLKKRADAATTQPLCLLVGSNWPHVPWPDVAPDDAASTYTLPAGSVPTTSTQLWRTKYAAAVEQADRDLGVVLAAIEQTLGRDTIILMSGDHGAQWPFGKWNLYDAGTRVPLIVKWPGKVKAATRTNAMVNWVDFLPTLLEAAGGTPPPDIDGKSFLPVLTGKATEHHDRIYTTHAADGRWNIYPMRSVRDRNWKYIRNLHPEFAFTSHTDIAGNLARPEYWVSWEEAAKTSATAAAIVNRYHKRPAEELYDLTNDPGEQHNLANNPEHQQRLKQMSTELDAWLKAQDDPLAVHGEPRLLSDPESYGARALSPDEEARRDKQSSSQ